jgi:hypothetical protein
MARRKKREYLRGIENPIGIKAVRKDHERAVIIYQNMFSADLGSADS